MDSTGFWIVFVLYLSVPLAFFCDLLRRRFRSVRQRFIAQPVQGARHVAAQTKPSLLLLITAQVVITVLMLVALIENYWAWYEYNDLSLADCVTIIIYGSFSLALSSYQLIILLLAQFPSSISALQISPQELAPMLWARHTMILVINVLVVFYFGIVYGDSEYTLEISYFLFLSATIIALFQSHFLRLYIQRLPAPPEPAALPPSANASQVQLDYQVYPLAMVVAASAAAVPEWIAPRAGGEAGNKPGAAANPPQPVLAEYASLPAHAVPMHYVGNGYPPFNVNGYSYGVPAYPSRQYNPASQAAVANPGPATEATEGQPSNATDVPRLVFCHNCGQQACHGAARYCSHCGTLLSKEPPPRSN